MRTDSIYSAWCSGERFRLLCLLRLRTMLSSHYWMGVQNQYSLPIADYCDFQLFSHFSLFSFRCTIFIVYNNEFRIFYNIGVCGHKSTILCFQCCDPIYSKKIKLSKPRIRVGHHFISECYLYWNLIQIFSTSRKIRNVPTAKVLIFIKWISRTRIVDVLF